MMPPDLAFRFNLAPRRHGPMKKCVEPRDTNTAGRWFDMLKKGRKAANNFSRVEFFGHSIKFVQRYAGLICPRNPRRWPDFFRCEFTLQREQNIPLLLAKIGNLHRNHLRRLICFTSRLNRFAAYVAPSESENSFCWHQAKTLSANFLCQQFAMRLQ